MNGKAVMIVLLGAAALMLPNMFAVAQQAQKAAPATADEATHEALRALKREAEASFNKAGKSGKLEDLQGLLDYVHDNVVLVAMNGDFVVGKKNIAEYFNKKLAGPVRTVRTIHHTFDVAALTTLYGGDTGVAYGTSLGTYDLTDGMNFKVATNWTATMVKENGKWQLASFQFGPNIFDNPVLKKAIDALYLGIGIAGAIGLILGYLLCKLLARKRPAA